jgi:hypothetical protein
MNENRKSKFSKGKGMGVPEILGAFFRVFCATSLEGSMLFTYLFCFSFLLALPLQLRY